MLILYIYQIQFMIIQILVNVYNQHQIITNYIQLVKIILHSIGQLLVQILLVLQFNHSLFNFPKHFKKLQKYEAFQINIISQEIYIIRIPICIGQTKLPTLYNKYQIILLPAVNVQIFQQYEVTEYNMQLPYSEPFYQLMLIDDQQIKLAPLRYNFAINNLVVKFLTVFLRIFQFQKQTVMMYFYFQALKVKVLKFNDTKSIATVIQTIPNYGSQLNLCNSFYSDGYLMQQFLYDGKYLIGFYNLNNLAIDKIQEPIFDVQFIHIIIKLICNDNKLIHIKMEFGQVYITSLCNHIQLIPGIFLQLFLQVKMILMFQYLVLIMFQMVFIILHSIYLHISIQILENGFMLCYLSQFYLQCYFALKFNNKEGNLKVLIMKLNYEVKQVFKKQLIYQSYVFSLVQLFFIFLKVISSLGNKYLLSKVISQLRMLYFINLHYYNQILKLIYSTNNLQFIIVFLIKLSSSNYLQF
ncbi:unnamed protein product [Paramecium pentaurelia]|uniref:Transmembrane protein n=1 Tax=Paramecium pentaurelia TaxID=43138 RepID=A0A8S1T1M7_9CILI|nr:unnamed protein product [Paramecium pentaurelia]